MRRESCEHGFLSEEWEAAKEEARQALIAVAERRRVIAYSDLVAEIRSLDLEPQSDHFAQMLGRNLDGRSKRRRGVLTVVVVHEQGDQTPGPGFFHSARTALEDCAHGTGGPRPGPGGVLGWGARKGVWGMVGGARNRPVSHAAPQFVADVCSPKGMGLR